MQFNQLNLISITCFMALTGCSQMQESLCPTPESGAFIIHTQTKKAADTSLPVTPLIVAAPTPMVLPATTKAALPAAEPNQLKKATADHDALVISFVFSPGRSSLTSAQRQQLAALPQGCYQLVGYEKSTKAPPYKVAYYRVAGVEKRLVLAGSTIKGVSALASNTHTPQDTRVDVFRCQP
jgi:hypothetical protein